MLLRGVEETGFITRGLTRSRFLMVRFTTRLLLSFAIAALIPLSGLAYVQVDDPHAGYML